MGRIPSSPSLLLFFLFILFLESLSLRLPAQSPFPFCSSYPPFPGKGGMERRPGSRVPAVAARLFAPSSPPKNAGGSSVSPRLPASPSLLLFFLFILFLESLSLRLPAQSPFPFCSSYPPFPGKGGMERRPGSRVPAVAARLFAPSSPPKNAGGSSVSPRLPAAAWHRLHKLRVHPEEFAISEPRLTGRQLGAYTDILRKWRDRGWKQRA